MVVGVCRLGLMVPESGSLKQKRSVLRSIEDRTRQKFGCAIAEVEAQDAWQRGVLGIAVVANERRFVERLLAKVVTFVEALGLARVVEDERDYVVYGEGEPIASDGMKHWEPNEVGPPLAGVRRAGVRLGVSAAVRGGVRRRK